MSFRPVVLSIDDNENNQRLIHSALKDRYEVISAMNGAEGLKMAQTCECDLILLDVKMPEISGYQVCQALRGYPKTVDTPVVFISAYHSLV